VKLVRPQVLGVLLLAVLVLLVFFFRAWHILFK
jgi:hypothetical protein